MICSKCGAEVSGNTKFCTKCGAPLSEEFVGKNKKHNLTIIIAGIIAVIAILFMWLILPMSLITVIVFPIILVLIAVILILKKGNWK